MITQQLQMYAAAAIAVGACSAAVAWALMTWWESRRRIRQRRRERRANDVTIKTAKIDKEATIRALQGHWIPFEGAVKPGMAEWEIYRKLGYATPAVERPLLMTALMAGIKAEIAYNLQRLYIHRVDGHIESVAKRIKIGLEDPSDGILVLNIDWDSPYLLPLDVLLEVFRSLDKMRKAVSDWNPNGVIQIWRGEKFVAQWMARETVKKRPSSIEVEFTREHEVRFGVRRCNGCGSSIYLSHHSGEYHLCDQCADGEKQFMCGSCGTRYYAFLGPKINCRICKTEILGDDEYRRTKGGPA